MDENEKKSSTVNKVISNLTKKKSSTTKKTSSIESKKESSNSEKDIEAMAKVQELLKNTPVAPLVGMPLEKKKEFDIEEHKQVKSQQWLEDQLDLLTKQVEMYENEIFQLKAENNALRDGNMFQSTDSGLLSAGEEFYRPNMITNPQIQNSGGYNSEYNAQIEQSVIELFQHFEQLHMKYNHDGNFNIKISHPQSGQGILDEFLKFLPFLDKIRRYNHANRMM